MMLIEFSVGPAERDKWRIDCHHVPRRHDYVVLENFVAGYVHSIYWQLSKNEQWAVIVLGRWDVNKNDYVPGFVVDNRKSEKRKNGDADPA